jgi:hypothetical protein
MQINNSNYSIAELLDMLRRGDLTINRDYQRGSSLWPSGPRSYFIDTILEGLPFPKIYFYEYIERTTGRLRRELIDGQQRLLSIRDFHDNRFALAGESEKKGWKFEDLELEERHNFLSYTVSVDVIRNADRGQILQMFKRMNAYTLPLNNAEKRHSSYFGAFKWFVNEIIDELSEFFLEFNVFTSRQQVRMADAEFIAECVQAFQSGIVSSSPKSLDALYKNFDDDFPDSSNFRSYFLDAANFISSDLSQLRGSYMMKPYAIQSLIIALTHARFRLPSIDAQLELSPQPPLSRIRPDADERLMALASAHEAKESEGPAALYVWGCSGGTNRAGRRLGRLIPICSALGLDTVRVSDDDLVSLLPK